MTIVVMLVIIIISLGHSFRGGYLEKRIYNEETESHMFKDKLALHHPSTRNQCYWIKTHISDDQLSNNIEACGNASGAPRWPVNLLMSCASRTHWSGRSEVNR